VPVADVQTKSIFAFLVRVGHKAEDLFVDARANIFALAAKLGRSMAAAIDISVHGDPKALRRNLSARADKQVRFVTVQALGVQGDTLAATVYMRPI